MSESRIDMQKAIDYIESNLTEELDINDIAATIYLSPFHFQRTFHAICGVTVGEYIRQRRLSVAGNELVSTKARIIDMAMKYGYDSPDSFSRAFTKFHGASPSAFRMGGMVLRTFAPIEIKRFSGGKSKMDYRIVEKAAFTVVGFGKRFAGETAYTEIPKFWDEHFENGRGKVIEGMFGVCLDSDGESFEYLIADMYLPWKDIPDGCITKTIDAATWAVFPWSGECPEALQTVNTWIWSEWLPNSKEYELSANCNLEVYLSMEHGEIWLPVRKK